MPTTLYHNPRCSKSRQTLELLQQNDIEPRVVKYLETPPDAEQLRQIIRMLGISAHELLRKKEAEFKMAGLDQSELDDDTVIEAMMQYPKLIERPIVVHNGKAMIGRPPEKVLTIFP